MAKNTAEDNSERKRISIPKADESVLEWWAAQKDPGLSVRLLVRNEIERNGYADTAFRPVAQLPRRGRPPVAGGDVSDEPDGSSEQEAASVHNLAPVAQAQPVAAVQPIVRPTPVAQPAAHVQPVAADKFSAIDGLMNG